MHYIGPAYRFNNDVKIFPKVREPGRSDQPNVDRKIDVRETNFVETGGKEERFRSIHYMFTIKAWEPALKNSDSLGLCRVD